MGGVEAPPEYHAALAFDVHQEEEEVKHELHVICRIHISFTNMQNPPPVPPRKSITEPEPLIVQDDPPPPAQQQLSTAPLNTDVS